jgi:hypothetical protein
MFDNTENAPKLLKKSAKLLKCGRLKKKLGVGSVCDPHRFDASPNPDLDRHAVK